MNHSMRIIALLATLPVVVGSGEAMALDCAGHVDRQIARFEKQAERAVRVCLRKTADCPDQRLTDKLAKLETRVARGVPRRCPSSELGPQIAAARARVLCALLAQCGPDSITVRVTSGSDAPAARSAVPRTIRVDAGSSGLAHDLEIFEGASYTATLSNCDGTTDTLCDLDAATDGLSFGAPNPISAGGVGTCVTIAFASDLTGTTDLATGDLAQSATLHVEVYAQQLWDRPCPVCVVSDGDPQLGESGTCLGGANDSAPCTVEGLSGPSFAGGSATSSDCGPGTTLLAAFDTLANATTGNFTLASDPVNGPRCNSVRDVGKACPCSVCNDGATACHTHADCPVFGGSPGVCRTPVEGFAETSRNSCHDDTAIPGDGTVCVDTGGGRGRCPEGPLTGLCAVANHRSCHSDADCPSGDTCAIADRRCHLEPIDLDGTPDVASGGVAHPTLVGGFCMGSTLSMAANVAMGLPGAVSFVWPAEITVGP